MQMAIYRLPVMMQPGIILTTIFLITRHGIEKMTGKTYHCDMPACEQNLADERIIRVLSFVKSKWTKHIRKQHAWLTMRVHTRKEQEHRVRPFSFFATPF